LRRLLFFAHADTQASWPDRFNDAVIGASEHGEKLKRFRLELTTEKTASFFRQPEELATLVLAAIMRNGLIGRIYNIPFQPDSFPVRSLRRRSSPPSLTATTLRRPHADRRRRRVWKDDARARRLPSRAGGQRVSR
jgi:hypothetical protein